MGWILFLISLLVEQWPADENDLGAMPTGSATYVLTEMNGTPAPAAATITFPRKGRIEGAGPCNGYWAEQSVPYPWIKIGAIASTRKTCPHQAFETAYFTALGTVSLAEVLGAVLILSSPDGAELVFKARN